MADRHAVIWTRTAEGPLKMGSLVATDRETRFSYSAEFLNRGLAAGLSLLGSPRLYGKEPVIHRATEALPLPPRLMALLPGRGHNNLQRRVYGTLLARRRQPPAPGWETEWELLMLAGRNGIGHLDVFPDDLGAEQWYHRPRRQARPIGSRSAFWGHLRHDLLDTSGEPEAALLKLIGPTPSVGGMIPKLLVAIPEAPAWDGTLAPPQTQAVKDRRFVDVILKLEYPEYAGLAALEGLCLDVHRELGFTVPRHWRTTIDDMPMLAVERFDRTRDGLPLPLESFYSVMASGSREIQYAADAEMERVGLMLATLPRLINLDARAAQQEVYRRFIMAMLTGNGDLHLENLAFIGGPDDVRVAPVYDPAPMRAWPRHNLLSALPFVIDKAVGSLGENVVELGAAFGLSRRDAAGILADQQDKTADYAERVLALNAVPEHTRQHLAEVMRDTRKKLTLRH